MHRMECPNCHLSYTVSRPRVDERTKCPGCGRMFIGTSTSDGLPPAAGVTDPATEPEISADGEQLAAAVFDARLDAPQGSMPRLHRPAVPRRGRLWMLIVAALAVGGVAVLTFCLMANLRVARVIIRKPAGEMEDAGKVSIRQIPAAGQQDEQPRKDVSEVQEKEQGKPVQQDNPSDGGGPTQPR